MIMKTLFRLFQRAPMQRPQVSLPAQPQGMYFRLDVDGRVVEVSPALQRRLPEGADVPGGLAAYLMHPVAGLEGRPDTWPVELSSMVLRDREGMPMYCQGVLVPQADGWLLMLLDNSGLVCRLQQDERRELVQSYSVQQALQMRQVAPEYMREITSEWLEGLCLRLRLPWLGLLVPGKAGWLLYAQANLANAAPFRWESIDLASLSGASDSTAPVLWRCPVSGEIAWLVPYREHDGVRVWLVATGVEGAPPISWFSDADWVAMLMLFAAPLSSGMRYLDLKQRLERNVVLEGLLDSGWWELHGDTRRLYMSADLAKSLGLELDESGSMPVEEAMAIFDPLDREMLASRLEQTFTSGSTLNEAIQMRLGSGRWLRLKGELVQTPTPRIVGYVLDVSDLKRQQEATAAARARLEGLLDNAPAVIFVQSYSEGTLRFEFCSSSLYRLLGWTVEDLQAMPFSTFVHPDDRDQYYERTRTLLRTGYSRGRYRVCDRRGVFHWMMDEAKLLRDSRGLPVEVVGLMMDFSEVVEATERIRESEERYRVLVEDAPAIICRYRPDLTLTFANATMMRALGLSSEQLGNFNLSQFLHQEDHQATRIRLARLTPEDPVCTVEFKPRTRDGRYALWVWSERGLFDSDGRLVEIQAVGRDDTQLHEAREQLFQSAKMATLGEMATGLAHEINQPLTVMRMALANITKRLHKGVLEPDYLAMKLERVESQVTRASRIVDHVRIFGRRSEVRGLPFDPGQCIDNVVLLVEDGMEKAGVQLEVVRREMPPVVGHPDRLEQVLLNLLLNAQYAVSHRELSRAEPPRVQITCHSTETHVFIVVEDNGDGIAPAVLARIFEPFMTTKPAGDGTGLGLSLSYGIINQMRGELTAENTGQGARFQIRLPVGGPVVCESAEQVLSVDSSQLVTRD